MKNLLLSFLALTALSCEAKENKNKTDMDTTHAVTENTENQNLEKATFAGGCFWCTEAVFLEIKGVEQVQPGYIGGTVKNPTYEEVCEGTTGHAEAIEIIYNPNLVSYEDLLEVFFGTHDPTTLNRQGADVGTQYRSEIFYHSEAQKKAAQEFIDLLNAENFYGKKVVTKISPATVFYVAEDYHKNYYNRNKNQGYCMAVIAPKLEKLQKNYQSKLKK